MSDSKFFEGLKVVELASVLAGPSVGMFFAELGATVVKVENATRNGDVTRNWRTSNETQSGPSAYFSSINYKKLYLSLDLNDATDKQRLCVHIEEADIVISNYQARVAQKLNLNYDQIKLRNPEIIFLQLEGFSGNERPAFDVVLQAETGWISMTGNKGSPAKMPVALIDVLAGHQLKEATLLALIKKMRTGKGSFVKCNLEKASLSALSNQATNYLMNGELAARIGTKHPNIAPYGDYFQCRDQVSFVLAIGSESQFTKLLELLNIKDVNQALFSNNVERLKNRDALNAMLQKAFSHHGSDALFTQFVREGIPYGEIKKMDKVMASQAAQEMKRTETIEGRETTRLSSIAFPTSFLNQP